MRMRPNLTKEQWAQRTIPGSPKSWFRAAECRFLMPAAPSAGHSAALLQLTLVFTSVWLCLSTQHMEFGSRKPPKQVPVLGNSEIFCQVHSLKHEAGFGHRLNVPYQPFHPSPRTAPLQPGSSTHLRLLLQLRWTSRLCLGRKGETKERGPPQKASRDTQLQRNTDLSTQLQDIFLPLVAVLINKSMLI